MKKLCVIVGVCLLGACKPQPVAVTPVDVHVPVSVPCRAPQPKEPDWNIPRLALPADSLSELKAELADLELSRGYIAQLKAGLAACG